MDKALPRAVCWAIDFYTPMAYNITMIFLETSVFTKRIVECLSDTEYAEF